jgi:hypothetical protein
MPAWSGKEMGVLVLVIPDLARLCAMRRTGSRANSRSSAWNRSKYLKRSSYWWRPRGRPCGQLDGRREPCNRLVRLRFHFRVTRSRPLFRRFILHGRKFVTVGPESVGPESVGPEALIPKALVLKAVIMIPWPWGRWSWKRRSWKRWSWEGWKR